MPYKSRFDQSNSSAKHYRVNNVAIKMRALKHNKLARKRNRAFVRGYLTAHPCVDCGNSDIDVLDFDHVTGSKVSNVADLVSCPSSIDTLQREIDKCEVRCSNCHRKATKARRKLKEGHKSKRKSKKHVIDIQLSFFD